MKNLVLLTLLTFFSCQQVNNPTPTINPLPSTHFKVNIKALNYTPAQRLKLEKASHALELIFNSQAFKEAIVAKKFSGGEDSSKVLETFLLGPEKLSPEHDFEMDLEVKMYLKRLSKVVGYTTLEAPTVYTNSKYHDRFTPCQVAANLAHEWSHKLGYSHKSATDKDSVPYALGTIVLDLCNKL